MKLALIYSQLLVLPAATVVSLAMAMAKVDPVGLCFVFIASAYTNEVFPGVGVKERKNMAEKWSLGSPSNK